MKKVFYYSYFLIFSFGILWSSCSEETNQNQLHINKGKKIEVKVSIPQLSLLSFDKHSRFIQRLPESGNGQLSYSFSKEDTLILVAKYKRGNPGVGSTDEYPPILLGHGTLFYKGNNLFSGLSDTDVYPEEFWGDSIYCYIARASSSYYTLETGLIGLTESNSSYYVGTELKNLKNNDTRNSYLYGVSKNIANTYWDTFDHPLSFDLDMARSYATIKLNENALSNILPSHNVKFSLDCDNKENSGLFPQYTKTVTIQGNNYTVPPAQLDLRTGKVQGFTRDSEHESHNEYSMTREELANIINNYDGLISFPIYPGEFKNLRITISTDAFMKEYTWKSNSATFSLVIGYPNSVDDFSKNIYSANRNFFFGNVTELKAE